MYDFVRSAGGPLGQENKPTCGGCHPGGGGLEYDRDGNRYDEYQQAHPEIRDELDGDYYRAEWNKSGVVEADCFICHFEQYDFIARLNQLKYGNFKWAATAAAGLGIISGEVMNGERPQVRYNQRMFNSDGTTAITISWPPPDENCLFCHGMSDVKKRGFSWNDIKNPDVHNQQGLHCVSCHPAGSDHNIAKGDEAIGTVRDDLDNTMMTCEECHMGGYLGASVSTHESIRPSHLKKIACESCHIPEIHRSAGMYFEASNGSLVWETIPPGLGVFNKPGDWKPAYFRREDRKIYPLNPILAIWWGNRDADGIVYPLYTREIKAAFEPVSGIIRDDDGNGKAEVNTLDEIKALMESIEKTLDGNRRFSKIDPVFVKGGKIYYKDTSGAVVSEHSHLAEPHGFSINHNVAPARLALGANVCDDCHSDEAHFFKGQVMVDPLDPDNNVITAANGANFGCSPWIFEVNSFHQQFGSPLVSFIIVIVIFFIVLHYHSYGPKRIEFHPGEGDIKRFSKAERAVHLFRLIAFIVLTITGLIFAFNLVHWNRLLFSLPDTAYTYHKWFGVIFTILTVVGIYLWFKDALFASYDRDWVKKIGGYLGYKDEVPAGRFNAGQKAFYWFTSLFGIIMAVTGIILIFRESLPLGAVCLTSTIHNFFGLVMIAGVLAHAYLGTVANPGTWQVLVDGIVTRTWAKHHHPNWYRELIRKGEITEKETGNEKPKAESQKDDTESGGNSEEKRDNGSQTP